MQSQGGMAMNDSPLRNRYSYRGLLFLFFNIFFIVVFFDWLRELVLVSWNSQYDTYIPVIPFVSAYLFYLEKKKIFSQEGAFSLIGLLVAGVGGLLFFAGRYYDADFGSRDYLAVTTFSLIVLWIGGFLFCYGARSFRAAVFPLFFLLFAVPIPDAALEFTILFLQIGSTELTDLFFKISGIPVRRDGFLFYLPSLTIEVAKECSGIRSSLSLVVTAVLASHFFLRTIKSKIILVMAVLPIAIIKNAVRIFALSALGVYVDQRIIASDLHRKGGVIFFMLALVLMAGVIVLLRRYEQEKRNRMQARKAVNL